MQERFATQQAWLGSFVGQGLNRIARTARFSRFQWTVSSLLAVIALFVGFSLLSIRSNTANLNANIKENTRAVLDLKSGLVKGIDDVDRRVADTNQKLSDIMVELDDLIAEQRKSPARQSETPGEKTSKPNAKDAGPTRRQADLTIHRRRSIRER